MDLHLEDKVAIVTGGSKGIGFYSALQLAKEGCHLGICGRSATDLDTAAETLRESGNRVVSVCTDVTVPEETHRFIDACVAELGRIDVLVNNAGGFLSSSLLESTDEDWQHIFEWNVFQVIRMIRLVVPYMREQGGGSIINLGSSSGWHAKVQVTTHYSASKATIIQLTERLALDLVTDNIRVNTVSPGSIVWPDSGWDKIRQQRPEWYDAYVKTSYPMGRLGKPEEVADVIAFLASPRSYWVNGRHIQVDGLEQSSGQKM